MSLLDALDPRSLLNLSLNFRFESIAFPLLLLILLFLSSNLLAHSSLYCLLHGLFSSCRYLVVKSLDLGGDRFLTSGELGCSTAYSAIMVDFNPSSLVLTL